MGILQVTPDPFPDCFGGAWGQGYTVCVGMYALVCACVFVVTSPPMGLQYCIHIAMH